MSVLELYNVSYKYPGTKEYVLKDINVAFEKGKVYAIVGKSGSGKSTLLSVIAGLDVCSNGEILYKGNSINKLDRDHYRAKNIGVVFQGYNLLPNMTAIDNILLSMNIGGSRLKNKKANIYRFLENRVGIDKKTADRKVLKMSGGEQQRVAIARALSHDPDVIVADEPTGNLDLRTAADILKIFVFLARKYGKCIIIVTHSREVAKVADKIWGMQDGRLIAIQPIK